MTQEIREILIHQMTKRGISRCDAEDIVQEAVTREFFQKKYDPDKASFFSYMCRLTHNQRIDIFRRTLKMKNVAADPEILDQCWAAKAEERLEPEEMLRVKETLRKLSNRHAETIEMIHGRGMSYKATSNFLGIPVGTIKSISFRSRELFEHYYGAVV